MALNFSRFDAVASRRRAPVVRHVRESILQKRVLLGAEIKMSPSPFRPPLRVWRWETRRTALSCTRRRHAGSAASQVVAGRRQFVIFYWVVQQFGASSNMCEPKRIRFLRMVRAWGAPQVRGYAMRRLHAARNAIRMAIIRYFSLGRVVKCADAALCDVRRLEIAFFPSSRERLFGFWSCCGHNRNDLALKPSLRVTRDPEGPHVTKCVNPLRHFATRSRPNGAF